LALTVGTAKARILVAATQLLSLRTSAIAFVAATAVSLLIAFEVQPTRNASLRHQIGERSLAAPQLVESAPKPSEHLDLSPPTRLPAGQFAPPAGSTTAPTSAAGTASTATAPDEWTKSSTSIGGLRTATASPAKPGLNEEALAGGTVGRPISGGTIADGLAIRMTSAEGSASRAPAWTAGDVAAAGDTAPAMTAAAGVSNADTTHIGTVPAGAAPAGLPTCIAMRPANRRLAPAEVANLLRSGKKFMANGKVAEARLVFQKAAEACETDAAFALGAAYDPIFLQRFGMSALADIAIARAWYERAKQLGSAEAADQLDLLASGH
jgi:hypothetical protein